MVPDPDWRSESKKLLVNIKRWLTVENSAAVGGTEPWSCVNKSLARPSPSRQRCYFSTALFQCKLVILCVSETTTASAVGAGVGRREQRAEPIPVIKRVHLIFCFSFPLRSSRCTGRDCAQRRWMKRRAEEQGGGWVVWCSIFINPGPLETWD